MTLNYPITLRDYLHLKLYDASKSDSIRKSRRRTEIVLFVIYAIGIAYAIYKSYYSLAGGIAVGGLLYYFLFQRQYKNRYARNAYKHMSRRVPANTEVPVTITFNPSTVHYRVAEEKTAFKWNDMKELIEIPQYFFLVTHAGESLIIPKNKLDDPARFKTYMQEKTSANNIPFSNQTDWAW